ncbi:MAG: Ig-like domain-containing protein, partial [SAR324 cluster bacterium]|nr:Ig-like domain-containing protein [SAR324 cluster bacterium]
MNSLLPWFVLILIFFFSLTIISCADDEEEYSDDFPRITEVTKVTTPTNDTTPDYTFSSTEAGTISYGGSCSSSTTISISGNNTITLDSLSDGTYSDCIIVVRGSTGYLSNILTITTFIVDTTAPTVSSVSTTADNQSSVAITDSITVTFSEAMDTTTITTNTSNSTCSG